MGLALGYCADVLLRGPEADNSYTGRADVATYVGLEMPYRELRSR